MKQIRKQLAALLLAVALAAACAAPAFAAATAASIELTRKGSITVTLRDSESGSAVSGGKLTLYQVASISRQNGNLSYDYTNGFENCGVSLGDLSESDLARTLDDKRPADSKGDAHRGHRWQGRLLTAAAGPVSRRPERRFHRV